MAKAVSQQTPEQKYQALQQKHEALMKEHEALKAIGAVTAVNADRTEDACRYALEKHRDLLAHNRDLVMKNRELVKKNKELDAEAELLYTSGEGAKDDYLDLRKKSDTLIKENKSLKSLVNINRILWAGFLFTLGLLNVVFLFLSVVVYMQHVFITRMTDEWIFGLKDIVVCVAGFDVAIGAMYLRRRYLGC